MKMKMKMMLIAGVLAMISAVYGTAQPRSKETSNVPVVTSSEDADSLRVQGEQRFRANCSRCHAAPQKFPPRMMATILRHMRVRATITDEDMRLVLYYMTQ